MISLVLIILFTIVMAEFILGNFANGFIALVNCIDFVKRQKISSADKILTAVVVFRISLLWIILINRYPEVFNPVLYRLEVGVINIAWTVTNHFSVGLLLASAYFICSKIAKFSNLIFLHIKWRVGRITLVIFLDTSIFLGFQLAVVIRDDRIRKNDHERNRTLKTELSDIMSLSNLTIFMLAIFIPFTVSLAPFLLLTFFLWKHLKKMHLNGKRSQDSSTKAHIKAMETVIFFLLLFAINFLSLITSAWGSNKLQVKQIIMLCQAIEFSILQATHLS
ncbi:taste receptor type 2 member 19-like [Trichechus inunguis]